MQDKKTVTVYKKLKPTVTVYKKPAPIKPTITITRKQPKGYGGPKVNPRRMA